MWVLKMDKESLLRQADHMWKILDNMAENNPEGYQHFIKKQMQEGSANFKPPEPVFCLSCEIDTVRKNIYSLLTSNNDNRICIDFKLDTT